MKTVSQLPKAGRIAVAQLSGIAMRHASGWRDPGEDPIAELHDVSRDPRLLGYAAAAHSLDPDPDSHERRAAELLRQAGADEQVIAAEAERVRHRIRQPSPEWTQRPSPGQPPGSGSSSTHTNQVSGGGPST